MATYPESTIANSWIDLTDSCEEDPIEDSMCTAYSQTGSSLGETTYETPLSQESPKVCTRHARNHHDFATQTESNEAGTKSILTINHTRDSAPTQMVVPIVGFCLRNRRVIFDVYFIHAFVLVAVYALIWRMFSWLMWRALFFSDFFYLYWTTTEDLHGHLKTGVT